MNVEKAFETYFALDQKRKDLDADYKERKAKIEDAKAKIKQWLGAKMAEVGTDQFKCAGLGIAFPETKEKIQVSSVEELRNFVVEQISQGNDEAIMLLNAAANQKHCREWLDEEDELPEGVELVQERVITIRRSK